MKAVLMSIKPKWCEKIFSGEKTVEVRKTAPKLELPFKVYVYRTKDKGGKAIVNEVLNSVYGGGKVIGEFVCDWVEKYEHFIPYDIDDELQYSISQDSLISTCLEPYELTEYGNGKPLYGWHITDPKPYDKPKELHEFRAVCKKGKPKADKYCKGCAYAFMGVVDKAIRCDRAIMRAPQSWCYVEEI